MSKHLELLVPRASCPYPGPGPPLDRGSASRLPQIGSPKKPAGLEVGVHGQHRAPTAAAELGVHLRVGSWAAEGDLKSYLTLTAWRSRWRMFGRRRPAPRRRLSCSERTFPRNYRRRIAPPPPPVPAVQPSLAPAATAGCARTQAWGWRQAGNHVPRVTGQNQACCWPPDPPGRGRPSARLGNSSDIG